MMHDQERTHWTYSKVVDAEGAAFVTRTYLEQADVRRHLEQVRQAITIGAAADIGAGYGRLSLVLAEFAPVVTAFEREPHFIAASQPLMPSVEFRQIERLAELPSRAAIYQFAMTFTVLQHLSEAELVPTVREIKRIVARPGYVLLCEETDPKVNYPDENGQGVTIGRPIERYCELFAPFELVSVSPRRVERSYRSLAGEYLLFAAS